MIGKLFYKLYVIALMALVVWAAQFMWPLIHWEFQHTGVINNLEFQKQDSDLIKMRKIRYHLDNQIRMRGRNLGDVAFREHYEKGHFHHVGQAIAQPALNGCDYCHSPFPHIKNRKTRAFRNMHGYFLSCETCHYTVDNKPSGVQYRWLSLEDGTASPPPAILTADRGQKKPGRAPVLEPARGYYGARIAPFLASDAKSSSIIKSSNKAEAVYLLNGFEKYEIADIRATLRKMHRGITAKPLTCDRCHNGNSAVLPYDTLGYSDEDTEKLKRTEAARLIGNEGEFHFPNLFIHKNGDQDE